MMMIYFGNYSQTDTASYKDNSTSIYNSHIYSSQVEEEGLDTDYSKYFHIVMKENNHFPVMRLNALALKINS